ncbi:MAG: ABC transporter permease, partial [Balneolaceae bacterium]
MLKNYIKIAFRNISRNRIYSTISVLGLAIGITGATLLYLYVNDELNYDNFHDKSDQIHRIVEISESADQETRYFGQTAPVLGATLKESYPEIQKMVRVYQPVGHIDMLWKGERIHERNYLIADQGFFQIFDFDFIAGNEINPLADPNSVVISERIAKQLFGNENPIGQELPLRNITPAPLITIKGVIKNVPENSHLQFDFILSKEITGIDWTNYLSSWSASGAYTYLLLDPSVNMDQFEAKLNNFVKTRMEANPDARNFYLQPLTDIYFNSTEIEFGVESAHGNIFYITIFSAIG